MWDGFITASGTVSARNSRRPGRIVRSGRRAYTSGHVAYVSSLAGISYLGLLRFTPFGKVIVWHV